MAEKSRCTLTEIGSRIKKRRRQCGLTQDQLADNLSETATNISKIENGRRPNLSVDLLLSIAEALGVSMDELCYTDTGSHFNPQDETDIVAREGMDIIKSLNPEDRDAAMRMLRGLAHPS